MPDYGIKRLWCSTPEGIEAGRSLGLTVATEYYFRVQPLTRKGVENRSPIVSVLVS